MDEHIRPVSETQVTVATASGQFCLDGGLGDPDVGPALLERARAEQPRAGNGAMLLVLCPHQNTFQMSVTVGDGAGVADTTTPARDQWQQVSEGRRIGHSVTAQSVIAKLIVCEH